MVSQIPPFRESFRRTLRALVGRILVFLPSAPACLSGLGQEPSNDDSRLDELSARAADAQRQGDYRSAAAMYQQILNLRPGLVAARTNLGSMQYLLGQYAGAVQTFEVVLRETPKTFVANLFLGLSQMRLRHPQQALPYLQRAQELNPTNAQAILALADAYAALPEYDNANQWYLLGTETSPRNADAWYGLGMSYLELQKQALERMQKIGPDSVYARSLLAESFLQQRRTADAISVFRTLA